MRFEHVALAGLAHVEPDEVVSSLALEERLAPLYERFGLSAGRLELMTGIRERRFFARGARPSDAAARAGALALERAGLDRGEIGALLYSAVCRDFLEPATASIVHARLELSERCLVFDVSNACLGALNALVVVAGMIERGEIQAGLVVGAEDGRALVEATLASLARPDTTRAELKRAFASLTIGSGAAALVLARADLAPRASRLIASVARSASEHHELCQGDQDGELGAPLMETDSEGLLVAGCALAARTFADFLSETGWNRGDLDRVVTHQVGVQHRRALYTALELDPALDFATVEIFGNTGSVALLLTLSRAIEEQVVRPGQRVALMGIGSGLACQMVAVEW